ncbi:Glutamyl-tRNA(Gln) amidotransferase subunit A [BD1-7 clade bacterium]|uniref:Glutamyl-tRNA(Gln) amidotransferase subunit A n=1 Tax=BD1-7 clade bacterium TaxID=2029982 RepID=A0A5S9MQF3_9GAMM|nr:Glutamyl-tRNA(Gln) amidotransferase subunit A [BD1-7 clade bacterium]CAA0084751.1 Glutamyl-tRNA(Gln) amidotransferase subunit A [BD1-7 clade bacterium]
MHQKTLTELIQSLQNKDVSSVELTQHYLDRINSLDCSVNSYITVTADRALEQARAADTLLANGEATSPLTGVPLAHKDIFCTDGVRTSAASKMLDNFIAPYNATVIEKFNQAGTVSLGKTNMDEFAMGSSNENSFYGAVKNPWDLERVPGGSSGGSAAAVAAHLAPAATGTDTGGSIRQPAAFCGLTGLKPTYGAVSRYGMIAYASSLDQAGPMARTAEDAALMMNVMAGFDAKDSTSIQREHDNYVADLDKGLDGLKIGMPKEYFSDQLDGNIAAAIDAAVKTYESLGATIQEVTLPQTQNAIPAYYIIAPAEASANLQRFDGVRYGHRCDNPRNLEDLYARTRAEGFGEEVQRRILVGTYALSAGFYDAYYRQAQKIRRLVKNDFNQAFDNVDLILAPTAPSTAFRIGEKSADPVQMYQEDIFTISVNLAGLPAISLPCGEDAGLPIGMQLIGNAFSDSRLLNAAHKYQQATDWHQRVAAFAKQG